MVFNGQVVGKLPPGVRVSTGQPPHLGFRYRRDSSGRLVRDTNQNLVGDLHVEGIRADPNEGSRRHLGEDLEDRELPDEKGERLTPVRKPPEDGRRNTPAPRSESEKKRRKAEITRHITEILSRADAAVKKAQVAVPKPPGQPAMTVPPGPSASLLGVLTVAALGAELRQRARVRWHDLAARSVVTRADVRAAGRVNQLRENALVAVEQAAVARKNADDARRAAQGPFPTVEARREAHKAAEKAERDSRRADQKAADATAAYVRGAGGHQTERAYRMRKDAARAERAADRAEKRAERTGRPEHRQAADAARRKADAARNNQEKSEQKVIKSRERALRSLDEHESRVAHRHPRGGDDRGKGRGGGSGQAGGSPAKPPNKPNKPGGSSGAKAAPPASQSAASGRSSGTSTNRSGTGTSSRSVSGGTPHNAAGSGMPTASAGKGLNATASTPQPSGRVATSPDGGKPAPRITRTGKQNVSSERRARGLGPRGAGGALSTLSEGLAIRQFVIDQLVAKARVNPAVYGPRLAEFRKSERKLEAGLAKHLADPRSRRKALSYRASVRNSALAQAVFGSGEVVGTPEHKAAMNALWAEASEKARWEENVKAWERKARAEATAKAQAAAAARAKAKAKARDIQQQQWAGRVQALEHQAKTQARAKAEARKSTRPHQWTGTGKVNAEARQARTETKAQAVARKNAEAKAQAAAAAKAKARDIQQQQWAGRVQALENQAKAQSKPPAKPQPKDRSGVKTNRDRGLEKQKKA
nr:hypothetical protein GCM10020241_36070 [Streptoalloteichus tenebrarius]